MSRVLLICSIIVSSLVLLILKSRDIGANEFKNDRDAIAHSRNDLPKLFDWEQFKKLFHKSYKSLKEEMIRKKIHLINSLKTFMHNILYRWSRISYFLSTNEFADWTVNEIDSMYKFKGLRSIDQASDPSDLSSLDQNRIKDTIILPEINEEELSANIQATIANKDPGFELLKTELEMRENELEKKASDLLSITSELRHEDLEEELASKSAPSLDYSQDEIELPTTPVLDDEVIFDGSKVKKNVQMESKSESFLQNQWARLSSLVFPRMSPGSEEGDVSDDDKDDDKKDLLNPSLYNFLSRVPKLISDLVLPNDGLSDRYIDWRSSGCLSVPRRQYNCGSCYAFATIAYLEWAHCKETGVMMAFSEQFMVDCGVHSRLQQCNGAYLEDLGDFVSNYGVELRKKYPYTAKAGQCPFKKSAKLLGVGYAKPAIKKWSIVDPKDWHTILNNGPMIASTNVPSDFQDYGGAIHSGHNCDPKRGHAMLLVGHGIENGIPYWVFKNSHGFYWGEYGYFRLSKHAKEGCFNDAIYSDITFGNNPIVAESKASTSAADKYKLFKDNMMKNK